MSESHLTPASERVPQAMDQACATAFFNEIFGENKSISPENKELLEATLELSPYLRSCVERDHEFVLQCFETGFEAGFKAIIDRTSKLGRANLAESEFMAKLRVEKRRASFLCGFADLSNHWVNKDVTRRLSAFARTALSACFDYLLLLQHEAGKVKLVDPKHPQRECGLVVLGMGKFGAEELNYSSDIDLIIFHDTSAAIELLVDDKETLLNRMGKQLIKLMQERTVEGYVFRTDLRLRPDPSSTPLIIPTQAALHYYEGQGQNWERAAMIKAAVVAGDENAGERFLKELIPFVWRKYLDFAAIQDVHSIKRQIHAHKGHDAIRVQGHNIKLGRGGIREIEFFVQTQQLIAGGRNPELRQRGTIEALCALNAHGWIEEKARIELTHAYWYLRTLEHRLQMVEDQQTHTIPEDEKEVKRIASMFGMSRLKTFEAETKRILQTVEEHYARLFEAAPDLSAVGGNLVFTGQDDDPDTVSTLEALGFEQPGEVIKLVKHWHVAKMPALQTSQARELLTELVPELLQAFGRSAQPDKALFTFDQFLSGLPAGIQLFSILKSNPGLNSLLVRILTAAPKMAEQIARKPHVFDAMIEPQVADEVPTKDYLSDTLRTSLVSLDNYELKLDQARRFFREIRFQIASRFFAGALDYAGAAAAISNLAEAMIAVMLEVVQEEFAVQHGYVGGARVCVLAMGRLGSRELTVESDLDLIFLYDFDPEVFESDGKRPLDPTSYFIRLIQRFIAAMSSPTAEGKIFELDFRLRPSGNAGPLATHIDAFVKYQREDAWIWEAQALTRARAVAGCNELASRIMKEVPDLLAQSAKKPELGKEIFKMRMLVEQEKGTDNVWDVKTGFGGLLDIEFIAQWLVLKNISQGSIPVGTRQVLLSPFAANLTRDQVDQLVSAFDLYSSVLHLLRTCIGEKNLDEPFPQGFREIMCTALDLPDISTCEAHLSQTKQEVRDILIALLGDKQNAEEEGL
ncbi:MAG: bifunctional [glutamine synthetase] adenylyltransferase/[glutamine synthetase]-adenylyl-L-tyrosine phosphorylase [Pseudomonadota bacterium]